MSWLEDHAGIVTAIIVVISVVVAYWMFSFGNLSYTCQSLNITVQSKNPHLHSPDKLIEETSKLTKTPTKDLEVKISLLEEELNKNKEMRKIILDQIRIWTDNYQKLKIGR